MSDAWTELDSIIRHQGDYAEVEREVRHTFALNHQHDEWFLNSIQLNPAEIFGFCFFDNKDTNKDTNKNY
jgi:hypothetical protein